MAIEIFHKSAPDHISYAKTHACIILLPRICAVSITNGPTMWIDTPPRSHERSAFTSGPILFGGKYAAFFSSGGQSFLPAGTEME